MSDEVFVLRIFNNEVDAGMAQELLQDGGVRSEMLKDDAGGMEPHLQLSGGVRLIVNRADAEHAHQILER
jgi:Putative prokaryotic signal transducing protein